MENRIDNRRYKEIFPIILCFLIACCLSSFPVLLASQQLNLSSLYRYNWQVLNPAAINHIYLEPSNKKKQYSFNASSRQQWLGFEGAPIDYNARFEYLPSNTSIKLGFFVSGDKAGASETNKFFTNFAYQIYFSKNPGTESFLSIGLNLGAVWHNINIADIKFQEVQPNLPNLDILTQSYADMGLGIFYRWKAYDFKVISSLVFTDFYAGISVPQTFTLDLRTSPEGGFQLERSQHFYFLSGAFLQLMEGVLLEPSIWLRYLPQHSYQTLFNNNPLSGDLNFRLQFNKQYWTGIGAGTNKVLHLEAGFNTGYGAYANDAKTYLFSLGLAADLPVGLKNWLGPSIEISLGISWN